MTVSLPDWRRSSRPRRRAAPARGAWAHGPGAARRRVKRRSSSLAVARLGGRRRRLPRLGLGARAAGRAASSAAARAASSSALRFSSARRFSPRSAPAWAGLRGGALPRALAMRASSASRSNCVLQLLARGNVVDRAALRRGRRRGWARGPGRGRRAAASTLGSGAAAGASPGLPRMRRFLTSTTTVFERPWLKLCLTLPVSTVRFRPSGGRVPSFGLSLWSLMNFLRLRASAEPAAASGVAAL